MTDPLDYTSLHAEAIVATIWSAWDERLRDWDLEGSAANREARAIAVEAVTAKLRAPIGSDLDDE